MGSGVFLSFLDVLKIGKLHFPPFLAIGLFTISLNYKIDQCSPIRAITSENKQIPPIVCFAVNTQQNLMIPLFFHTKVTKIPLTQ